MRKPGQRAKPSTHVTWRMLPEGETRVIEDIRDAQAIREGALFLLTDRDGGVPVDNSSGFGLYHNDTRYLSAWDISLIGVEPIVLLSTAELGFGQEQVMTNPELVNERGEALPGGSLLIRRQRVLDQALIESLRLTNYAPVPLALTVVYEFGADFADIFELRGQRRRKHGHVSAIRLHPNGVTFRYRGLDLIPRQTRVRFRPLPDELETHRALFYINLLPGASKEFASTVLADAIAGTGSARRSLQAIAASHQSWKDSSTRVTTSNELLNAALDRSLSDMRVLWSEQEPELGYVAAGIPWFDTLFGRDSAIAAMMCLAFRPQIAERVLRSLAHFQGKELDPSREEEPGKIVHEIRNCEAANAGEVVFGRYYGSIDSTPLFLLLAAEYYHWTADLELLKELRPALDAALEWMDLFGDPDGDGYLEYIKKAEGGLDNQGWKDSWDGIIDREGDLLKPPTALVEVQGYACAARRGIAEVYQALGSLGRADELRSQAAALQRRINADFWMPGGYYALALDGDKRPSAVLTSNAGQLLWAGVPTRDRARQQIRRLLRHDMFSGWGIRTLSLAAKGYNPMGYHLGTIWPHDNALLLGGFKRYGAERELNQVATALAQAAFSFPYYRLPELFSGAPRMSHQAPVPYPVACRPQAFAAAALPYVLTLILGLAADAPGKRLYVVRPRLPSWIDFVRVANLRVGDSVLELTYRRSGQRTSFEVTARSGSIQVVPVTRWP
ncbi:MAG: glycogen debranching N-terminal domain-containing protein [Dehalococcoidia bacterium]|nr:glycogen debranching N-terminal domain-containing protein [Dehalococcoidia bacterium]